MLQHYKDDPPFDYQSIFGAGFDALDDYMPKGQKSTMIGNDKVRPCL